MENFFVGNISKLEKPRVRTRFSWNFGVYKNPDVPDPEFGFKLNRSTEIKLIALVAVITAVLFAACLCRKMSKLFK